VKCPVCKVEMIEVEPFEMDVFRGSGIYGCPKCKRLWLYEVVNVASTTDLLRGWGNQWASSLKPYTERYCAYPEVKAKFEKILEVNRLG